MVVRNTHLTRSVAEFVRHNDQHLDALLLAAILNYVGEKESSEEKSWYKR